MTPLFQRLLRGSLLLCSLLPVLGHATLTGVTVNPKQAAADMAAGQTIAIRWIVSTTPSHTSGAYSAQGQLIDPVTSAVLQTVTHPLKQPSGAGPVRLDETLTLTPTQLQEWQAKGISALRYQRSFGSNANDTSIVTTELSITPNGNADANTPRAPSAGLFMHKLGMRFENARNRRSFSANSSLRARVDLRYSGTGVFDGEWQVALPTTDKATPQFTALVKVRKQLGLGRRDYLVSPELPTTEPGVYRVRFCVLPQLITPEQLSVDTQCPEPELVSELAYRVEGSGARESQALELLTPRAITVTPTTPLEWKAVTGAAAYQLQIYSGSEDESLDGSDFVLRMLSSGAKTRLHLSDWARQQLEAGKRYRWRISAYDENGQQIGASAVAEFTYMP
ncbi:MAG: hypothetical protein R3F47_17460 [Gammaproteobacteria bacterium]